MESFRKNRLKVVGIAIFGSLAVISFSLSRATMPWREPLDLFRGVVVPVLVALGFVALFVLTQGWLGLDPRERGAPDYLRDLPTSDPPAVVGWLTRSGVCDPLDFTATIIDLARRGHIRLDRDAVAKKHLRLRRMKQDGEGGLHAHEDAVLDWLFRDGEIVRADQIDGATHKKNSGWDDAWRRFAFGVDSLGNELGYVRYRASDHWVLDWRYFGLVIALLGVMASSLSIFWVLTAIAGAVIFFYGGFLARRTGLGAHVNAEWEAFARFLRDFSTVRDWPAESLVIWDDYLPYAIVLGQSSRVTQQLRVSPPANSRSWITDDVDSLSTSIGRIAARHLPRRR